MRLEQCPPHGAPSLPVALSSWPPAGRIRVVQRINHEGDVNRARHCPQVPERIATKSSAEGGLVFVFDYSKHFSDPDPDGVCKPQLRLKGHKAEASPGGRGGTSPACLTPMYMPHPHPTPQGYGLAWSPRKEGWLASGSHDRLVCLWDTNGNPGPGNSIQVGTGLDAPGPITIPC